jgi:hypothetical protein
MSTVPDIYKSDFAKPLNKTVKQTQNSVKAGSNTNKRQVGRAVTIDVKNQQGLPQKANRIKKAKITAVEEDYLECTFYSERTDTDLAAVKVAKSIDLRPSYYDGQVFSYVNGDTITYTKDATNPEWKREADDGSTAVDQIPIPCFRIGEIISIVQTETSVVVDDVYLIWQDITPRVWAVI